jgi:imidazole glycerol-phosphate synthase subunit HisF
MLRSRIIPFLLLTGTGLIKTKQFKRYKYIGDVINAIRIFNEKSVDELALYGIDCTLKNEPPNFKLLSKVAKVSNMPLTYGGGIKSIEQAKTLVDLGFEKISLSSSIYDNFDLISKMGNEIGFQSIVVTIDYRRSFMGSYVVYSDSGTKKQKVSLFKIIDKLNDLGVGEIILNAIDRDGMRNGYDIELLKKVFDKVDCPITIVGGCDSVESMEIALKQKSPIGLGVGSFFVFKGNLDAVLINYTRPNSVEV